MGMNEIHQGDIGTVFEVTLRDGGTALDVSGATTKEILLKPVGGTMLTKTAVFVTDGTDGKIKYATLAGDLSVSGPWELQVHVAFAGGEWRSDVKRFTVHPNLT